MSVLILQPEFFVDLNQQISTGPVLIKNGKISQKINELDYKNATVIRLKNQVLMPGFINAHSHSFQRVLRGLVERSSDTIQDNFWTWRHKMYEVANKVGCEELLAITTLLYLEMLEAGFTHVGEFHYLHHDLGGRQFLDPLAMSRTLKMAAQDTGINLCLLESFYHQHSFGSPLREEQRRFAFATAQDFLAFADQARAELSSSSCCLGLAIHSTRCVPQHFYADITDYANTHNLPLHVHASEQEKEVADCIQKYAKSPIQILHDNGVISNKTTLIHAIHLINKDADIIAKENPVICLCPSTEKNLGDGVIHLNHLMGKGTRIAIGTDQHVRLDPFHELQSLEDQERTRLKMRSVLNRGGRWLYQALLPSLTTHGLASLYPTSTHHDVANLIAIDLPPEYEWHGPHEALDAMILSHTPAQVSMVMSKGQIVVHNHRSNYGDKSYLIKTIGDFFKKSFSTK